MQNPSYLMNLRNVECVRQSKVLNYKFCLFDCNNFQSNAIRIEHLFIICLVLTIRVVKINKCCNILLIKRCRLNTSQNSNTVKAA